MSTHHYPVLALMLAMPSVGHGQEPRLHYPPPPPGSVTTTRGVPFGPGLAMDVYRPSGGGDRPALIVFAQGDGSHRALHFFAGWGEIAAANGLVGIVPDLHHGRSAADFGALLSHLRGNSSKYGIDANAIAVYAASGNVSAALPLLQDPTHRGIAAVVAYYGEADVAEFRRDLPLMVVRAGLDRPPVNEAITRMIAQANTQNAPLTVLNYPNGHHGFESVDDGPQTRDVIDQTIAFVKRWTDPSQRTALAGGVAEATAAAKVSMGRFHEAIPVYAELVTRNTEDTRLGLSYGEALLGGGQFEQACSYFDRLEGKGLGPRDLGLPAARACVRAGKPDAAVRWLRSIPKRFLPASVKSEPVFLVLAGRSDFEELFR